MTHKSSDKLLESLSALADGEISELELHRLLRAFADDSSLQRTWQNYHLIRDVLLNESRATDGFADGSILQGVREAIDAEQTDDSGLRSPGSDKLRQKFNHRLLDPVAGELATTGMKARPSVNAARDLPADGAGSARRDEHHGSADAGKRSNAQAWQAWLGKSAVAASVAVAFVVGLGQASNWSAQQEPSAVLAANVEQPGTASMSAPLGFELPAIESRNVSTEMNRNFSPALAVSQNPLIEPDASSEARAQQILNQLHIMHAERATANGGFGILPFARVSEMDMSAKTRVQR